MTDFENNLWDTVLERHGDYLAHLDPPTSPVTPKRRRRSRWAAGVGATLAALAAAVSVLINALSGAPAFAVDRLDNGAVLVKIDSRTDLPQANAKLRDLHLEEQVIIVMVAGRARTEGPVSCSRLTGVNVPGPPLEVLVGHHGTESGSSGTYHLGSCVITR